MSFIYTRVLTVVRQGPCSAVSSGLLGPQKLIQDRRAHAKN